jgi:hypothetical protein
LLMFSKQAPDLLFGMIRCLWSLAALPELLVWDREGALHAGGGRPTDVYAAFCGQLAVDWQLLRADRPRGQGHGGAPPGLSLDQLRARPTVRERARRQGGCVFNRRKRVHS